ncbi:hypothetical protein JTE90_004656 [Oedothorax gibbosus]|uniref:Uncharacterized protein n=1 Tax=Oedothorax gibbosus TaxID=931172 RepID=A0AAV6UZ69_9ARAC|nr:hypothetical protein JTE90_004656 [Oedothorax gibbosus]
MKNEFRMGEPQYSECFSNRRTFDTSRKEQTQALYAWIVKYWLMLHHAWQRNEKGRSFVWQEGAVKMGVLYVASKWFLRSSVYTTGLPNQRGVRTEIAILTFIIRVTIKIPTQDT